MSSIILLLLFIICIGLIYIVHRYFGKHEFYLLTVIYSITSFIMSFRLISLFGLSINMSIIFNSGIIMMMYYFVNRFDSSETKKFIAISMISILSCIMIILLGTIMSPSIYDESLILFKDLFYGNVFIILIYPLGLFGTLLLSRYAFIELKKIDRNRSIKILLTLIGIMFVDIFVFIYFSYVFTMGFSAALLVAIGNYFIKIIVISVMYLLINKVMRVKKVKS